MGVVKARFDVDVKNAIASLNNFNRTLNSTGIVSDKLKNRVDLLAHTTQILSGAFKTLNWSAGGFKSMVNGFVQTADEMRNLDARLRLASSSTQEFIKQQRELFKVAQGSFSSIKDVTDLYSKLSIGLKQVGFNADEITKTTENFTKALQLGGATAKETSSAILQFSQAMGSGVLRGQEFNAVAEASPKLMSYLAQALKVPQGQLRKMAEQGKLTSKVVANALLEMSQNIQKDFATLPLTVERAVVLTKNELTKLISDMNNEFQVTQTFSSAVAQFSKFLSQNKENIIKYTKEALEIAKVFSVTLVSIKALSIGVGAFNSIVAFSSSVILPALSSQLGFATASTILLSKATTALNLAFKTLLPVAVIASLFEYFTTMKEITNATKDSYIEVSNWRIYTTEAVNKVINLSKLCINGWELFFVSFGEFIAKATNEILSGVTKSINFIIDKINYFKQDKIKKVDFSFSDETMNSYVLKKQELLSQNEQLMKSLVVNNTKALIDAHNKEVDLIKSHAQKVVDLTDNHNKNALITLSKHNNKKLKLEKDYTDERLRYQIEYFEKSGKIIEAWKIKEAQLLKEFKKINLDKKIADEIIKFRKKEYLDKFVKLNKHSFKEIKDSWNETVMSMAKAVEDNFFNFFTGKTTSLSKMFRQLGKDVFSAFISPYAKNVSSGIGGFFSSLLGGNNTGSSVSKIATSLGLSLANGVYAGEVNGVSVKLDSTGNIIKGSSAFGGANNILSLASNLNSVSQLFNGKTGIIETFKNVGSSISNFGTNLSNGVSSLFNTQTYTNMLSNMQLNAFSSMSGMFGNLAGYSYQLFGNAALANGISNFGTNFSSALTGGSTVQGVGGFAGSAGTILGSAGLGYGMGRLAGGLGDKLFHADTYASKYGGIGGAVGGAIGGAIASGAAAGSWAGPIGAAIGAAIGVIVGGLRGRTKVVGSGLKVLDKFAVPQYGVGGYEIQNYVKKKKKSWVKSKSWYEYFPLEDEQRKNINSGLASIYNLLKKAGKNTQKFYINSGEWSKPEDFIDGELKTATIRSFMGKDDVSKYASSWAKLEDVLKGINKYVLSLKSLDFEAISNPIKKAKFEVKETFNAFKTSFDMLSNSTKEIKNIFDLSVDEFKSAYQRALNDDFSQDNFNSWEKLKDAYLQARKAQIDYTKSVLDFISQISSTQSSFYQSQGIDTGIMEYRKILSDFRALLEPLEYDISPSYKSLITQHGSFDDIQTWGKYLLSLNMHEMSIFLQNGNTELRRMLVDTVTAYQNAVTSQGGGHEFWIKPLVELEKINKQIQLAKKADQENTKISLLEKQLQALRSQKEVFEKIINISDRIVNSVVDRTTSTINYEFALQRAKLSIQKGENDPKIIQNLEVAANNQEKFYKDTSLTYEEYKVNMLQMANDIRRLTGHKSIDDINKSILDIQEHLLNLRGDSNNILSALNIQRDTLIKNANLQISAYENLLGSNSAIVRYLKDVLETLKKGEAPSYTSPKTEDIKTSIGDVLLTTANGAILRDEIDKKINSIYLDRLGRSAEQSGLNYWKKEYERIKDFTALAEHMVYAARIQFGTTNKEELRKKYATMGFKPFADGGIVTRPIHALIGEAGYPEAVIPLRDGKGLKVDMDTRNMTELLKEVVRQSMVSAKNTKELNYTIQGLTDGDKLFIKAV